MRPVWTVAGVLLALTAQLLLVRLAPAGAAAAFDPFLLVVVHSALTGGERRGMLMGLACGWIQDTLFAGPVLGLTPLAKLLVGFGVGLASTRFLVAGAGPRALVLSSAALLDVLLFERLAALLGASVPELPLDTLVLRALLAALVGAPLLGTLERRLPGEGRR